MSWRWWMVLPICYVAYLYQRAWLGSWIAKPCLPPWILFVGFSGRAISWSFLCKVWHCGKLSHTILLAQRFASISFCRLALHPCSSSWLPSKLGAQAQLVSDSFSIDELERWHANGGFISGHVCPKCIRKLVLLTLPHFIDRLLQDIFDLLVRSLCLAAGLRMIRGGDVVLGPKLP